MALLTPPAYLAHLERAVADFADVLRTGDLDAPVPGCPQWSLTDLAHHLGGVHRWARTAVVEGRPGSDSADGAPTDRDALVDWFGDGATALVSTLHDTPPDSPCWTFGPPPGTAAFWFRRQAHESAMHAADAAGSQGAARPYGAELAVDGVDEVVHMFLPRQVRLGRTPELPVTLALESADGTRWLLGPDGDATATVHGPAETLLLLLWKRVAADDPRLRITGRLDAAEAVLAMALTP